MFFYNTLDECEIMDENHVDPFSRMLYVRSIVCRKTMVGQTSHVRDVDQPTQLYSVLVPANTSKSCLDIMIWIEQTIQIIEGPTWTPSPTLFPVQAIFGLVVSDIFYVQPLLEMIYPLTNNPTD